MMLNSKEEPRTTDKEDDKADEYLPETSGKTRKQRHQTTKSQHGYGFVVKKKTDGPPPGLSVRDKKSIKKKKTNTRMQWLKL